MEWPVCTKNFLAQLQIDLPIIQAPMAGGITTPDLVAAVSNAGGLGSIGAGLLMPDELQKIIQATAHRTRQPFAVNLFTPLKFEKDQTKIQVMNEILTGYRQTLGIDAESIPEIKAPPSFEDQLEIIIQQQVPIVSFTFGTPSKSIINKLQATDIIVMGTATNVREAIYLENIGYDMIIAQGSEAGGHRGTFLGEFQSSLIGTMALVPQIVDAVNIPVIAAGGIMDGRGLIAAINLGASAAQMGTAFLTCTEAGTHPQHQQAILNSNDQSTAITAVFSGRPARGIRNQFMEEMEKYQDILPDYPLQQSLTSPIRKKAAQLNQTNFMALWAGQATRLSQSKPAAQLVKEIAEQAQRLLSFRGF